jgi:hypothetical protein
MISGKKVVLRFFDFDFSFIYFFFTMDLALGSNGHLSLTAVSEIMRGLYNWSLVEIF